MFSLIKGKAVAIVTAIIAAIGSVLVAVIYREKSKRKDAELRTEKLKAGSATAAARLMAEAQAADQKALKDQEAVNKKEIERAKNGDRDHFE